MKYFSGTVTYEKTFDLPASTIESAGQLSLDLGDVKDVVEVYVNGRHVGGWTDDVELVGLFGVATYNLQLALSAIEERVEVVVYLRDDARQSEIDLLLTELAELPEVRLVHFVSKRDALERARAELPEFGDLFSNLEVNPMPQSLEVELRSFLPRPLVRGARQRRHQAAFVRSSYVVQ